MSLDAALANPMQNLRFALANVGLLTESCVEIVDMLSRRKARHRRRLKYIHSRSGTNRTGAEGSSLFLPQTAALPGSDAGSDIIKLASSFVI